MVRVFSWVRIFFLGSVLLAVLFSYQNCSEKAIQSSEEGGFVKGSFADLVGTPCERFAVGLDEVSNNVFEIDTDQGGTIAPIEVSCKDISAGEGVELTILEDAFNLDIALMMKNPTVPLDIVLNIPSGVTVGSTSTFFPAIKTGFLHTNSTFTLNNEGLIQGAGGKGGHAGACGLPSLKGEKGGVALDLLVQSIVNTSSGRIESGGGGGGGGGDACIFPNGFVCDGGGAGGGGAGSKPGQGGSFTMPRDNCAKAGGTNRPGANGSSDSGGVSFGVYGGRGGAPGEAGADGLSHTISGKEVIGTNGAEGGDPGEAIVKNGNTVQINGRSRVKGPILDGAAPPRSFTGLE